VPGSDALTSREIASRERFLVDFDRLVDSFDRGGDRVHVTGSAIVLGERETVLHPLAGPNNRVAPRFCPCQSRRQHGLSWDVDESKCDEAGLAEPSFDSLTSTFSPTMPGSRPGRPTGALCMTTADLCCGLPESGRQVVNLVASATSVSAQR